jgi:hypothetical protein
MKLPRSCQSNRFRTISRNNSLFLLVSLKSLNNAIIVQALQLKKLEEIFMNVTSVIES